MKLKKLVVTLLTALTISTTTVTIITPPLTIEAHSGRTDKYGGHKDKKNKSGLGSYHYHCGGHPAHLHPGGVCPYDNNSYNASSNTSSSSSSSYTPQQQTPESKYVYTYTAKYKDASTEYSNKASNGSFSQAIIDLMPNYQSIALSLLSQQEIEDYTYLKNSQDIDDISKLIFIRMYDYVLSQQSQEAQQQQQTQSLLSSEYDNLIFSAQYYATTYPDLVTIYGYDAQALYNHFMTCGLNEGRQGISTFNVSVYRANNPDLEAVFGDNLILYCNHYMGGGHHEERVCH